MSRAYSYIYTVRDAADDHVVVTGTSDECAAAIGVTRASIPRAARLALSRESFFLKQRYIVTRRPNTAIDFRNKYYRVYLRKTGELVCAGTAAECAKAFGYKAANYFNNMYTDCKNGKVKKWDIVAVPYKEISPDLTPIPAINNSAYERAEHHSKPHNSNEPRTDSMWYSVYLKKTDELLASGTATECAKALGIKNPTDFRILAHRNRKGIHNKYEIYSEPYYEGLDEEEPI